MAGLVGVLASRNSLRACRHMPHGLQKSRSTPSRALRSVATPSALKSPRRRPPVVTAVPSATRSAQVPDGYAAFSKLAPGTRVPLCANSIAPTRKCEYGPVDALVMIAAIPSPGDSAHSMPCSVPRDCLCAASLPLRAAARDAHRSLVRLPRSWPLEKRLRLSRSLSSVLQVVGSKLSGVNMQSSDHGLPAPPLVGRADAEKCTHGG